MKRILPFVLMFVAFFVFACNGEKAKYKATFYSDGEVYLEKTVTEGELLIKPGDPIKDGFTFIGWFNGEVEYDFNIPVNKNLTLTAEWEENAPPAEFYDIELVNEGKTVKIISIDAGDPLRSLEDVKVYKEFYEFKGWYLGDELITDGYVPTSNLVLEARWEALGEICILTLDGVEKEILKGEEYELPFRTREGFGFLGWRDKNNNVYCGVIVVEENMNLRTTWKASLDNFAVCNVKLENVAELELIYQETYTLPNCSKLGYEFLGWTDGKYNYLKDSLYIAASDVELTPIFEAYGLGADEEKLLYAMEKIDYMVQYDLHFPLTSNVSLPTTDENGVAISWSSSDTSVITNSGEITRMMTADHLSTATMTVTFDCNGKQETKEYTFTVKRELKDISTGVASAYMSPGAELSEIALDTLDIVNGAFLYFNSFGEITGGDNYVKAIDVILGDAHAKGVRVLATLGAQSASTSDAQKAAISVVAGTPGLRIKFAQELLSFVVNNNLDGVDMDWETPRGDEIPTYTLLMKEIYETFKEYDSELLVTSAIGAGPWLPNNYDLKNSAQYHDYINMMSYDLQNPKVSTHHSALYASTKGYIWTNGCSVDDTMKMYTITFKIPKEKIIIGIPFYGRIFKDSLGIGKKGTADGSINQQGIQNYLKTTTEQWDDQCKVPYIYISEEKIFITYENPRSIQCKMEYVNEKGLGGVMYWQNAHDYNDLLITAINENLELIK